MNDTDRYWNRRLDELRDRAPSRPPLSEVRIAGLVGISPAMLGHVRAGRRSLPAPARARLLDHLGYVLTRDLLIRLLPDDVIAALAEIDRQRPPSMPDPDPNAGRELPPVTPEQD